MANKHEEINHEIRNTNINQGVSAQTLKWYCGYTKKKIQVTGNTQATHL